MKKTIRILQISDLHKDSPEREDWLGSIDDQQPGSFSDGTLSRATLHKARRAKIELGAIIGNRELDLVLFHGDLGYRGDLKKMQLGAKYIIETLAVHGIDSTKVRCLVGNHDVRWFDKNKFQKVSKIWKKISGVHTPLNIHFESFNKGDAEILLCSANTCQDAGEKVQLPTEIKVGIEAILKKSAPHAEDIDDQVFQLLDIASIDVAEIDRLISKIREFNDEGLIIFQGHHSSLPQEQPRLGFCPELVQAGYLRQGLLNCRRPVLYLHGHTHCTMISSMTDPRYPDSYLLNIGCEEFPLGFNLIEVEFESFTPLSIRVESFTQGRWSSGFSRLASSTISLLSDDQKARLLSDSERKLLTRVIDRNEVCKANELIEEGQSITEVAEMLERLWKLGLLRAINPEANVKSRVFQWPS